MLFNFLSRLYFPSCSLAFNGSTVVCYKISFFAYKPSPLARLSPNAKKHSQRYHKKIRQDKKTYPVLFTRDAIRTHDLPLRRRLLYPAELLGLGSRGLNKRLVSWGTCIIPHTFILTQTFFFARLSFDF